jgi:hypothetical protein
VSAHDLAEAVQYGGSLRQLTLAVVHPLLEEPAWSMVLGVWLLALLSLYRLVRRITRPVATAC